MPYVPVNGLDMYYEAHGDGSPLLLLHGGSGSIPGHAASIPELSLFQTTTCVSRPTGQSTGLSFSDV